MVPGFTPLILAATGGHSDVVEMLLDNGADIEAQSERTKDTPLSLACSGGRYEVSIGHHGQISITISPYQYQGRLTMSRDWFKRSLRLVLNDFHDSKMHELVQRIEFHLKPSSREFMLKRSTKINLLSSRGFLCKGIQRSNSIASF